jgi:hypothetical protein
MGFYVHYDREAGETYIHYANCPFCKHGFGQEEAVQPKEGEWLGPFNSYFGAEVAAEKTKADLLSCDNCRL